MRTSKELPKNFQRTSKELPKNHFLNLKFTGNFVHPPDICNFAKNIALKQWFPVGLPFHFRLH